MSKPPDPIAQFFTYAHLPPHLQEASRPFCKLGEAMLALPFDEVLEHVESLPDNNERDVAILKLIQARDAVRLVLEAKDAGVRAVVAS